MTQAKPTGDSSQSNRSKNRLKTPLIVAAATLIGAGVIGGLAGESSKPAQAQSLSERIQNVVPFPGAPASFADLVERVRPSVVSINVKKRASEFALAGTVPRIAGPSRRSSL